MSRNPQTPDDLIDAARTAVRELIVFALSLIVNVDGPSPTARTLKHLFRSNLEPAEALLRRALHLLAARLPALAPPAARAAAPQAAPLAPADSPTQARPRRRKFRLTEALPRPGTRPPPPPNSRSAPLPRKAADYAALRAQFEARVAALEAACDDPVAAARRLQRLIARRRPRAQPLAPKPPSGLIAMRFETYKILYRDLHAAALRAWPRLNTS